MTIDTVREVLRSRRPFKIVMADGRTLNVPHPEFAMLSRSGRILYVSVGKERVESLDVLLITALREKRLLPS